MSLCPESRAALGNRCSNSPSARFTCPPIKVYGPEIFTSDRVWNCLPYLPFTGACSIDVVRRPRSRTSHCIPCSGLPTRPRAAENEAGRVSTASKNIPTAAGSRLRAPKPESSTARAQTAPRERLPADWSL